MDRWCSRDPEFPGGLSGYHEASIFYCARSWSTFSYVCQPLDTYNIMDKVTQLIEARNRNLQWALYYEKKAEKLDEQIKHLTEGEI